MQVEFLQEVLSSVCDIVVEIRPVCVFYLRSYAATGTRRSFRRLCPVIRLLDDIELDCRR